MSLDDDFSWEIKSQNLDRSFPTGAVLFGDLVHWKSKCVIYSDNYAWFYRTPLRLFKYLMSVLSLSLKKKIKRGKGTGLLFRIPWNIVVYTHRGKVAKDIPIVSVSTIYFYPFYSNKKVSFAYLFGWRSLQHWTDSSRSLKHWKYMINKLTNHCGMRRSNFY